MSDNLKEREMFEEWLNPGRHTGNVSPWVEPGRYEKESHQLAWLAWSAAIEADRVSRDVPATQDVANLLSRFEHQWHRMGELWERCQGKGWPDKEGAEFTALRDEKAPATRAKLIAMLAASPQPQPVQAQPNLLSWAVDRWLAEVSNRPMVNVHRRSLDDTWRQVIRFAGGDPDELVGPSHDSRLAVAQPKPADQQKGE